MVTYHTDKKEHMWGFFIYLIQQLSLLHDNGSGVHLALAFTGIALATVE